MRTLSNIDATTIKDFKIDDIIIADSNTLTNIIITKYGNRYTDMNDDEILLTQNAYNSLTDGKWKRIYDALAIEYNPLDNYNSVETHSETFNGETSGSSNTNATSTETNSTTNTNVSEDATNSTIDNETVNDDTTTVTNRVNAFNDTALDTKAQDSTVISNKDSETSVSSNTTTHTSTDTTSATSGRTDTDATDSNSNTNNTIEYTTTKRGNIGVTTSQQMLQSEIDIARYSIISEYVDGLVSMISYVGWCI